MSGCMMTGISGRDVVFYDHETLLSNRNYERDPPKKTEQCRIVALYMKGTLKCVELIYGMDNSLGECLWIGIKRETNEGGTVMEGYCRPHSEEVDEVFCKQL